MSNAIANSSQQQYDLGDGVRGGIDPSPPATGNLADYDFDAGTNATRITEFVMPGTPSVFEKLQYSPDKVGPSGTGKVVKVEKLITQKYSGGNMVDIPVPMDEGEEIWCRWYQYFPAGFVFANGVNGDDGGSAASIKWMRFQFTGNSERITLLARATGGFAPGDTGGVDYFQPVSLAAEGFDWVSRYGNQGLFFDGGSTPQRAAGSWHAVQMYLKLSRGDVSTGDGDGVIRIWVDEDLVDETFQSTLPQGASQKLESVWMGDYWNGGYPQDQAHYIDDVVITTEAPLTLDAADNPFIAPYTTPYVE